MLSDRKDSCKTCNCSQPTQAEYLKQAGIELGKVIGKGSYSKVRLAVLNGEHRVAAKIMSRKNASKEFVTRFLPREIEILPKLSHPNIAKIYRIIDFQDDIYVFMELAEAGTLFEHIQRHNYLSENEAKVIFRQLLEAISYLHNQGIYHRDLKCENVLIRANGTALLTDFGFSRSDLPPGDLSKTFCGSALYASPELLSGQPYQPAFTDIWSLGVVLFTMVTGKLPYGVGHLGRIIKDQLIGRLRFPDNRVSPQCQVFIRGMLEPDPNRRYTAQQCLDNPWMRDHEAQDRNKKTRHLNFLY